MARISDLPQLMRDAFPRATAACRRTAERLRRWGRAVKPGDRAWRGAAAGLALATGWSVLVLVFNTAFLPRPTAGKLLAVGYLLGTAVASAIAVLVAAWALRALPRGYRRALVFGIILMTPTLGALDESTWALVYFVAATSAAGAGFWVVSRGGMRDARYLHRIIALVGFLAGVAASIGALTWLYSRGTDAVAIRNAAAESPFPPPHLTAADPSLPGGYAVLEFTYGSGKDRQRPEFGRNVDVVTEPVDGSDFVENWKGWSGWARTRFWGFDVEELPLQGRVWYPDGEGPFPLVLIVHGNHGMEDYSDPGYAYLGETLASRGYILVSVDENFINSSAGDRLSGGLREENDARGWLLLEHLRQWRDWSAEPEHVLGRRVDMGRIGLIGHSRGGEAVAVAAAFNRLPYYPDDATVAFDYGFDIGAVLAIAPVYGQYRPAGLLTPLRDVNYLVLHGANDGDVSSFAGSAQYERVSFSGAGYHFKSTVYVQGANHGQFNSTWGDSDAGAPFSYVLNRRALIAEADQRQIGKVFIGAFLEAALGGHLEYLALFADARRGADWLPDTIYLTDFRDSRSRVLATFDEDLDVTTTTAPGGSIRAEGLTRWREDQVGLKYRTKETGGVYLGWQRAPGEEGEEGHHVAGGADAEPGEGGVDGEHGEGRGSEETPSEAPAPAARYTIRLPPEFAVDGDETLFFSLADAKESAEPKSTDEDQQGNQDSGSQEGEDSHVGENDDQSNDHTDGASENDSGAESEGEDDEDEPREPIDFTLRLVDAAGTTADLPLSRFSLLQPQVEVEVTKGAFADAGKESEVVYQTFEFPLAWFVESNPTFDPAALAEIQLVFDRTEEAVVVLDELGFRRPS